MDAKENSRAYWYDRALYAPGTRELRGGKTKPFTFGRYVLFLRLLESLRGPDARPVRLLDAGDYTEPDDIEINAFAAVLREDEKYLGEHLVTGDVAAAVAGSVVGMDVRDMEEVMQEWRAQRSVIAACGVEIVPRGAGHRAHDDAPIPPEAVVWPAGHAGIMHAVLQVFHDWDFVLWHLPLAAFLSHAHCAWVVNSATCAPRGYLADRRAEVERRMATPAADLPDDAAVDLDGDDGAWSGGNSR